MVGLWVSPRRTHGDSGYGHVHPFLIQHLPPAFAVQRGRTLIIPPPVSPLASGSNPNTALPSRFPAKSGRDFLPSAFT